VAHYAKIGGNTFSSNYSQGGKEVSSMQALPQAIRQYRPQMSESQAERAAEDFIFRATALASKTIRKNKYPPSVDVDLDRRQFLTSHKRVRLPASARVYRVMAPPLMVNVDVVATPSRGSLKPVVMEGHVGADFDQLKDLLRNHVITSDSYSRIIKGHIANLRHVDEQVRLKMLNGQVGAIDEFTEEARGQA
jgi:hypothetical protein